MADTGSLSISKHSAAPPAAVPVAHAAAAAMITPKEILGILRRRIWMIIIVTVAITLVVGALWFLELRYHPAYTSQGLVQCLMPVQPDILAGAQPLPSDRIIALQTESRAMDLKNETFLSRVLQRTRVQGTVWFKSFGEDRIARMEEFKKCFFARPLRDSEFVVVSMTARKPEDAKLVLDEALEEFRNQMLATSTSEINEDLLALQQESDALQKKIGEKRLDLSRLRTQADVPGWEKGQSVVAQEMNAMHLEKLRLQALLQEALYQKTLLEKNPAQSPRVSAAIEQDPMILGFKSRIVRLNEELNQLLGNFGEEHQLVKDAKNRIQTVQQQMADYQQQLQMQYSSAEQSSIDRDVATLQQEFNSVSTRFDETSASQKDLETKLAAHELAKEELDVMVKNLDRFNQKIDALQVNKRTEGRSRVKVEMGNDPLEVSYPLLKIFLPGGFILGLMIALSLVFALEFFDDSVKSPSDVARHLHVPLLGMVPYYEEDDADTIALPKITAIHPHTLFSDAYRYIRTNLFFSAPAGQHRSFLITSAAPGCGKTVTAVNLAITLAAESRKVLLVDANFRRPAIAKIFPESNGSKGLSHLLIGHANPAQVIRPSGIPGLDLIDSGPLPPSPADLINSRAMRDFVQQQSQDYDHLIIDSPPALLFSDAGILAGHCDGTILVVRAQQSSRGMVQRMLRELHKPNIRVLGLVLNAVKPRKGGYFEKTYETYQKYIESSTAQTLVAATHPSPDSE
jgi:polysaccharide biosynthesis transport protein